MQIQAHPPPPPVSPPMGVETNWIVITGAPCSGKTTLIASLSRRGCRVVPEVARDVINHRLAQGFTLEQIKADILGFERHILLEKARIEEGLPCGSRIYMDRAVPDSIAYFRLEGLDPQVPVGLSRRFKYKKVFLCERLSFERDAVRSEDQIMAARLEELLVQGYTQLGYALIPVPVLKINQRVRFILDHAAG